MASAASFEIGETVVPAGSRRTIELPVSVLSDHTPVTLSAHVVHGRRPGPTLFVSAAIHGDEVIGVEIVRRLLRAHNLEAMRGTLIAVPIVNSFGFMNHSRYLPDRRDLNRSFPGSRQGSLAARLADLFFREIVLRCDVGIDLHSAAIHRTNLPQIRISTTKPETRQLADAFGAPLVLRSKLRDGSLRQAAAKHNIDILLYEAGEGLRFDELSARTGVRGILRVMHRLGMIPAKGVGSAKIRPIQSSSSTWCRAPAGGLLRTLKSIGDQVSKETLLGIVADPFGEKETEIRSELDGLVIGRSNLPIVNEGDGVFHIARIEKGERAQAAIDGMADHLEADPLFDEDEII